MPSVFDLALSRSDAAQLRVFGEVCTFHDPAGDVSDVDVKVVFSERDIAERPKNTSAPKGQYSTGWTTLASLPEGVDNPEGYQFLAGTILYTVAKATADGGGGVLMKLHKARTQPAPSGDKTMDDVLNMDHVTNMDTLAETA